LATAAAQILFSDPRLLWSPIRHFTQNGSREGTATT